MATIEEALFKLSKSKFRSSFHLTKKEKEYVAQKGHPVFKAQHACACCCRGCLSKWYRVPKNVELSRLQVEKIVKLLMAWINTQMT